jgi:protein tyrosine phosphatase (PTP) superfamily phosphohydrolase (DUF442 family)
MTTNTLKTVWGYLVSLIGKYTPFKREGESIEDIYNYHRINGSLCTSGQPTERQFRWIQLAGYDTVINLLPDNTENYLANEADLVEQLGMAYIHIPVDFKGPTHADFERFANCMQATSGQKVWVHCAANMRVSAFAYKYRRDVLGENAQGARPDLDKIWQPFGVWKTFID